MLSVNLYEERVKVLCRNQLYEYFEMFKAFYIDLLNCFFTFIYVWPLYKNQFTKPFMFNFLQRYYVRTTIVWFFPSMNFAELLIYLLCKLKILKSPHYINHELLSSFKVLMKVLLQPIRGRNDYQNMNFKKG